MAFSNTPAKTLGVGSGVKYELGTWTGTEGDADGSISLRGGRVYGAQFLINAGTSMWDAVPITTSVSSGVITVTINNRQTVTDGTYFILYE